MFFHDTRGLIFDLRVKLQGKTETKRHSPIDKQRITSDNERTPRWILGNLPFVGWFQSPFFGVTYTLLEQRYRVRY